MGNAASGKEGWRVHPPNHGSIPEQRHSLKLSEVPGISRLIPVENLGDCFLVSQGSAFILISLLRLSWRIQKSLSPLHPLLENKSEFKGQKQWGVRWLLFWPWFYMELALLPHCTFQLHSGLQNSVRDYSRKINNSNLRSPMLYKVHVRCEEGVFPAMGRYLEWPFAAKTSKMLCTVFRQNLLVRMRGYLFLLLQ